MSFYLKERVNKGLWYHQTTLPYSISRRSCTTQTGEINPNKTSSSTVSGSCRTSETLGHTYRQESFGGLSSFDPIKVFSSLLSVLRQTNTLVKRLKRKHWGSCVQLRKSFTEESSFDSSEDFRKNYSIFTVYVKGFNTVFESLQDTKNWDSFKTRMWGKEKKR